MRKITAILTAMPGRSEALSDLLLSLVEPSRLEPGNLRWDVWRSQDDPTVFILDELYRDQDAVAAHRASAHFERYRRQISGLAARQAIVSEPIDVASTNA